MHYSFDLWYTLIRANPAFKQKRAVYFHKNFNFSNKSLEEVDFVFRQVNEIANFVNEKSGKNLDSEELYLMAIFNLNDYKIQTEHIDIHEIIQEMEVLFLENHPVLYSDKTAETLRFLKEKDNSTINILSNTGFAKGKILREVLEKLQILHYFDFQLYSDEVRLSKPNPAFFNLMIENVRILQPTIALNQIIHIGDNPIADIEGAKKVGVSSMLINSNDKCISDILH